MSAKLVMLVDDKEENIYLLRTLLQGNGFEVSSACNGAEALEAARKNPPDLLVADILMPVMDGFALCREWRNDVKLKNIPFVFYTATYTDERDQEFAISIGADRFIVKPQEPDVLISMFREIISRGPRKDAGTVSAGRKSSKAAAEILTQQDESQYLKQYNEALIRKLELKMEQLEKINRRLERDIAARRQAEAALRESEARFRSLVDAAPEAIFVQSGGRFLFVNPATAKMLGADRTEDMIGQPLMDRIAPEWHQEVHDRIRYQVETGKPAPLMEQEYVRMDGSRIAVETTAVPVQYQGRQSHLVFVRDITERKIAEQEREKLQAQLAQAQKLESIGHLAGGIAHDFNNELSVIQGYAEIALLKVDASQPIFADLQEIKKASKRSADLTRQLLAFARKQTISPKMLDLNETIEGILKMLRRLIGEGIILTWTPGPDLWKLKMDPSQIDQILANLCVNARDAIADIGRITISTGNTALDKAYCSTHQGVAPGEYVLLSVADNGCGMTKDILAKIFDPFFTTKELGKGTGMGLATVYGIVKQNNGFISVASEPGKGTAFSIYLPRHIGTEEEIALEERREPVPGGSETILLMEDETSILNVTTAMLERVGYQVLPVSSPAQALSMAERHEGRIHLMITDVIIPEMNVKDLVKKIMALHPDMKILFMSGYTSDVIAHHGVLDEDVDFIQKPFSMDGLMAKVRETLDRR